MMMMRETMSLEDRLDDLGGGPWTVCEWRPEDHDAVEVGLTAAGVGRVHWEACTNGRVNVTEVGLVVRGGLPRGEPLVFAQLGRRTVSGTSVWRQLAKLAVGARAKVVRPKAARTAGVDLETQIHAGLLDLAMHAQGATFEWRPGTTHVEFLAPHCRGVLALAEDGWRFDLGGPEAFGPFETAVEAYKAAVLSRGVNPWRPGTP